MALLYARIERSGETLVKWVEAVQIYSGSTFVIIERRVLESGKV